MPKGYRLFSAFLPTPVAAGAVRRLAAVRSQRWLGSFRRRLGCGFPNFASSEGREL